MFSRGVSRKYSVREFVEDFKRNRTESVLKKYYPEIDIQVVLYEDNEKIFQDNVRKLGSLTPTNFSGSKDSALKMYNNLNALRKKFTEPLEIDGEFYYLMCPYCGFGEVGIEAANIDHFLPKSIFPMLAVMPANLVPCCATCNHEKNNFYRDNNNETIVYPFYNKFVYKYIYVEWYLTSTGSEPVFKFIPSSKLPSTLRQSYINSLEIFNLNSRFNARFANQLIELRKLIEKDDAEGDLHQKIKYFCINHLKIKTLHPHQKIIYNSIVSRREVRELLISCYGS